MPTLPEEFQMPEPGKLMFPVNVGLAESTRLVLPVEPDTSLIEETRLAKVAEVPKVPPEPVVTNLEAVNPEKVIVPEEVRPVKLVKVPAMVELPVTAIPPEETVKVVTVGEVAKTKFPVPVVPVTEALRLSAVIELVRFFEASVATNLEAVRPEKLIVPEEVIPVAAAIAPEELIWNKSPEPTVNRAAGEVSPMPTFAGKKIFLFSSQV